MHNLHLRGGLMLHNCKECSRAKNPLEALICLMQVVEQMKQIKNFDPHAWRDVEVYLRRPLRVAIQGQNWDKVASIWEQNKYLVEVAIRGKSYE